MYDQSSFLIVAILFVALLIATELGFRLGQRFSSKATDDTKSQINSIQASILGVLALLLGFTFSLSLQRYDVRSQAVVAEASAISTAISSADLLPEPARKDARRELLRYLDLRIAAGKISLDRAADRDAVLGKLDESLGILWGSAAAMARVEQSPANIGTFLQSLNQLATAYNNRNAALDRHVPEIVLFLMFITLVLAASLVGYSSGISMQRASFAAYTLLTLIVCLVFLIIDLDRPRRGLVEVSQQSLIDLQASQKLQRPVQAGINTN